MPSLQGSLLMLVLTPDPLAQIFGGVMFLAFGAHALVTGPPA